MYFFLLVLATFFDDLLVVEDICCLWWDRIYGFREVMKDPGNPSDASSSAQHCLNSKFRLLGLRVRMKGGKI